MKWSPGQSPLQQHMQRVQAEAQARWQRDLQMGWWEAQQTRARDLPLRYPFTRRVTLAGPNTESRAKMPWESTPSQSVSTRQAQPAVRIRPWLERRRTAIISETKPEYNTKQGNQPGMSIHVAFSIMNLRGCTGSVAAYFHFANGVPLKDFNDNYCSTAGTVGVAVPFTPLYDNTLYKDFVLFMPYSELHMAAGKHSLKFFVDIWDDQNRELTWTDWFPFTYTLA